MIFELDLVLRNNITTEEHPAGCLIIHMCTASYQKENIGCAISRLLVSSPACRSCLNEMQSSADLLVNGTDLRATETLASQVFFRRFPSKNHKITKDNVMDILH